MADLTHLSNELHSKKATCRAIIETPKGSRNKFDYDPDSNLFMLGGLLPEGMMFPFDFGFIPSTLADDGDPLDVMVLMDAPAHAGCLIEKNDRLLAVAIHSYDHENLKSIDEISKTLLDQVEAFFVSYNEQRGKKFRVTGTGGPKKAIQFLQMGIEAFEKEAAKKKSKGNG
jgi:inorganic pyrophosphatase